jgi:tetratricopeptide (TPR) repeat protein
MGFRVQKSFKVAKGVRLNVSKSGIGMSVGTRGARYSAHSSGRTTRTVGIPGSGVRYQTTRAGGRSPRTSSPSRPASASEQARTVQKPGLLAPKGEKALYKAIAANDAAAIARVGHEFADYQPVAYALAAFMIASSNQAEAERMLEPVFDSGQYPHHHSFAEKYLPNTAVEVEIARGVTAMLPLSRDAVGLLLAEIKQEQGQLQTAIDTVEHLEPSTYAAVSLAELYSLTGRHQDIVDLTENVANEDDATALLCVFRGQALHQLGFHDAALIAFKEAVRTKARARVIRHLALSERARTYEAMGRKAMARKDLERILAEDSTYEGLHGRISSLADTAAKTKLEPGTASPADTSLESRATNPTETDAEPVRPGDEPESRPEQPAKPASDALPLPPPGATSPPPPPLPDKPPPLPGSH